MGEKFLAVGTGHHGVIVVAGEAAAQLFQQTGLGGDPGPELDVVHIFLEPVTLDELLVVGVIIASTDGRQVTKPLDEKPLRVQVGEPLGASQFQASGLATPVPDPVQEQVSCLLVIHGLEPAEAASLVSELFRFQAVDDATDPPEDPAVFFGQ